MVSLEMGCMGSKKPRDGVQGIERPEMGAGG